MAKNIGVVGNYLIIDEEAGALKVFPSTAIYSESASEFIVRVDARSKTYTIPFNTVGTWFTAPDGLVAFTEATLRILLQGNTGK